MSSSSGSKVARTFAAVAVPIAVAVFCYARFVRPRQLRWGSEEAEVSAVLPGDELVREPKLQTTRAVTIGVRPAEVWPWLVQIGYGRAGFYSYDASESVAGADIRRSRTILPEFQQLQVGDVIPWGDNEGIPVRMVEPESVLSLGGTVDASTGKFVGVDAPRPERSLDVSWTFVLRPVGEASTRLLTRTRVAYASPAIGAAVRALLEPGQFLMERKMLLGIKERAEGRARGL